MITDEQIESVFDKDFNTTGEGSDSYATILAITKERFMVSAREIERLVNAERDAKEAEAIAHERERIGKIVNDVQAEFASLMWHGESVRALHELRKKLFPTPSSREESK